LLCRLAEIGIDAQDEDITPPGVFELLRRLEECDHPSADAFASTVLQVSLLRAQYSVDPLGHQALKVGPYAPLKPRLAPGLANQHQLEALYTGQELLSRDRLLRLAEMANFNLWWRDIEHYRFRFYDMLVEHLSRTEKCFEGTYVKDYQGRAYFEVEGFTKWVIGPEFASVATSVAPFPLRLKGFDINEMRFLFEDGAIGVPHPKLDPTNEARPEAA
jgi:hypothetical protein